MKLIRHRKYRASHRRVYYYRLTQPHRTLSSGAIEQSPSITSNRPAHLPTSPYYPDYDYDNDDDTPPAVPNQRRGSFPALTPPSACSAYFRAREAVQPMSVKSDKHPPMLPPATRHSCCCVIRSEYERHGRARASDCALGPTHCQSLVYHHAHSMHAGSDRLYAFCFVLYSTVLSSTYIRRKGAYLLQDYASLSVYS